MMSWTAEHRDSCIGLGAGGWLQGRQWLFRWGANELSIALVYYCGFYFSLAATQTLGWSLADMKDLGFLLLLFGR